MTTPSPVSPMVKEPLPRDHRRFIFSFLLLLFVCAVPIFAFYATGYRYDIFATNPVITATGGLYVSVPYDESKIFLNDDEVTGSRIFREAIYIQGVGPGVHRLHVQTPGYQTWVKELPVYPHLVTEAAAFQFPERPQLRPVAAYTTSTGTPVYLNTATTTVFVPFASTTLPMVATTSKATSTLTANAEYLYVRSLFGTTTATTTTGVITRVVDEARQILTPQATSTPQPTTTATTTIVMSNTMLFERGDDVVVRYTGPERSIPYYFCIPSEIPASSSERFSAQVIAARLAYAAEQGLTEIPTTTTERQCRREIVIDRGGQEVISFEFFPGTTDLVLVHRTDGVFVTEVDDRAWQNTQQLYPASADALVVDGNRLFVKDDEWLFEILTELPTS